MCLYAGVNVLKLGCVYECTSIPDGMGAGIIRDGERKYKWKCDGSSLVLLSVAATNKLEFLKWVREVKQCKWDEKTINAAAG